MQKGVSIFLIIAVAAVGIGIGYTISKANLKAPNEESFDVEIWSFYHQGEYQKAVEIFQDWLKKDPENLYANGGIGSSYYHLKDYEKAITHLEKSISVKPTPFAYHGLGWAHLQKYLLGESGSFMKAEEAFILGVELKESDHWLQHSLGWLYLVKAITDNDPEFVVKAQIHANIANNRDPADYFTRSLIAFIAYENATSTNEESSFNTIAELFEQAIILKEHPEAYIGLGNTHARLQNYQLTRENYQNALALEHEFNFADGNMHLIDITAFTDHPSEFTRICIENLEKVYTLGQLVACLSSDR